MQFTQLFAKAQKFLPPHTFQHRTTLAQIITITANSSQSSKKHQFSRQLTTLPTLVQAP